MAGMFELFIDAESYFRFRLTAPDGTVMAVSKAFDNKTAAVAGIAAVREYAGMGLIADVSPTERRATPPEARDVAVQVREVRRIPAADLHARSREIHRAPSGSRWAGAV
ncbi:YegP family protein [Pseudarthrobacter sp.]|uniref:YegP family protein n=1 Tax=Pseudarthrobacter sp. TaxID=1934409 RepID=UPI002FCBDEC6